MKARERAHEALPHSSKRWVIEISVICDKPEDSDVCAFNSRLRLADELHVVVLQPELPFVQRATVHELVGINDALRIFRHV